MALKDMTLSVLKCPLCCRPGFSTPDSLCAALLEVTTRKLCCPICDIVVIGLDKLTIHLFSHSVSKNSGIEKPKEPLSLSSSNSISSSKLSPPCSNVLAGIESHQIDQGPIKSPCPSISSKTRAVNDCSLYLFRAENGQIFTVSPNCIGPSYSNVTINTQNYITNNNIGPTLQTNLVQKRKYSEVLNPECSQNISKSDISSVENCSNVISVNSWPSSSSVSSETEKYSKPEKEFESCKDLLTKGDFSTASDDISESVVKKDAELTVASLVEEVSEGTAGKAVGDSSKDTSVSCDLCPIVLPNKTILAMHKQLIHKKLEIDDDGKQKLDCSLCLRTFSSRSSLLIHRKVAHGGFGAVEIGNSSKETPTKHACEICGKFFKKEIHLNQHKKAHDEKQWQCSICSKTFTTKYFLKKHRRLHTGETPYKCNKCDKAFTFQQSYHKHLLYHNDEKRYSCAQCGRLFKELSTLHNHERIHSGEKPFTCETCGKAFRQRVSYLVHRRIHTGAMPYKCTACSKSFRYKISQRTHKCPAQPPGVVIRTNASLVERLQAAMSKAGDSTEVKVSEQGPCPTKELGNSTTTSPETASVSSSSHVQSAPLKVQQEKTQLYILFKGPNDENYYQPLILSPALTLTPSQNSPSNTPHNGLLVNSSSISLGTVSPKNQFSDNALTSNTVVDSDNSQSDCKKSKYSDEGVRTITETENSPEDSSNQFIFLDAKAVTDSQENLPQPDSFLQNSQLTPGLSESSHSRISTMDDMLSEFNCGEICEAQKSNATSSNSCESPSEAKIIIDMDSTNDIFSFMLSPDLSSPSDRFGRLTLSPSSSLEKEVAIEDRNPSLCEENVTQSFLDQRDDFLDISDDALKELLFGKTA